MGRIKLSQDNGRHPVVVVDKFHNPDKDKPNDDNYDLSTEAGIRLHIKRFSSFLCRQNNYPPNVDQLR